MKHVHIDSESVVLSRKVKMDNSVERDKKHARMGNNACAAL